MYGATEASARLTYLHPDSFNQKIDSIGKAIPGVTVTVRDEQGNEQPAGKEGELVARGENIMMGYYKDPEATHKVLDRWGYHTGDYGYRDEEGFLFVSGRKDELIKVSGYRVNISEIETCILESGLAVECAVVPEADAQGENKLLALVAPVNVSVTAEALHLYCQNQLPPFKRPRDIVIAKAMPKNVNGKIDRDQCRAHIRNHIRAGQ
jgi:acyl-CoA synthetase (AMP-forming)/AMP-acid ligase II